MVVADKIPGLLKIFSHQLSRNQIAMLLYIYLASFTTSWI